MKQRGVKYNIAVSGSAATDLPGKFNSKAKAIGRAIAKAGGVLFTGATFGYSLEAVKGARSAGGVVIGISPAEGPEEQQERYEQIKPAMWSQIIYTGTGYDMHGPVMMRSVDAVIFIGGGVGTLAEMAIAVDYKRVLGVLVGSGGAADLFPELERISHRYKPKFISDSDPSELVAKVIKCLKQGGLNAK